jgi:type II secretory pathway pseudopilin PulG
LGQHTLLRPWGEVLAVLVVLAVLAVLVVLAVLRQRTSGKKTSLNQRLHQCDQLRH